MKFDDAYIYGKDVEVPEIPRDVIVRRLGLIEDQLTEVNSQPYWVRDLYRRNVLMKAKKFWENVR